MASQLRYSSALSLSETSYNEDGGRFAALTLERAAPLGTADLVNLFVITATSGTAALIGEEFIINSTTVSNAIAATVVQTRPMGGSGQASINALIALDFKLSADPVSSAEIEAGVTGSRDTAGIVNIITGGTIHATFPFAVDAPGQICCPSLRFAKNLTNTAIEIIFTEFSLKTRVELITVGGTLG